MENRVDFKYYNVVKNLMKNLDIDSIDTYLRLKIFIITKQVTIARERLQRNRENLARQNNRDEIRHLKYDIEEGRDLVNNLIKELEESYDIYAYYKENIKKLEIKFPSMNSICKEKGAANEYKRYT